jgi:uncharacterized membrane protein
MVWTRDRLAYVVVGFGVGALVDGFLLHQVLQWHHVWSARIPDSSLSGLETNTYADGVFHVAFLVVLLIGLAMLTGRRVQLRPLIGYGLIGWGLFLAADQLVFHMALGAHHIRMGVDNYLVYDWAFFALGIVLIVAGYMVARAAERGSRAAADAARTSGGASKPRDGS